MKYIVDRIEGNLVVCETYASNLKDVEHVIIEKSKLATHVNSSDVIYKKDDGKYYIDKEETARLKEETRQLFEDTNI